MEKKPGCFYCGVTSDNLRICSHCDSQPGELVLRDSPFTYGPTSKSAPVCLHCGKIVTSPKSSPGANNAEDLQEEEDRNRCQDCSLPLCREGPCSDSSLSIHKRNECPIFAETFSRSSAENQSRVRETTIFRGTPCPLYACVTPLRLLLAMERNPDVFKDRVDWLIDHEEERKRDQKTWMLNHVLIVGYLRGACRLSHFSNELIHRAIGLIRTNGVKVDPTSGGQAIGTAIYPTYALINHSCLCNTRTKKLPQENHALELYSVLPIRKGEEISTRYTTPQLSTFRRQQMTQNQWHFSCQCPRCRDPTEMGTMMTAVRCEKCKSNGFLLPTRPTELKSDWKCSQCEETKSAGNMMELCLKIEAQVERAKGEDSLSNIISKSSSTLLHPNHFLLIRAREKILALLKKRQMQLREDWKQENLKSQRYWEELIICLDQQVKWFGEICDIMAKVDPPADVWLDTLNKLKRDLECSREKCSSARED